MIFDLLDPGILTIVVECLQDHSQALRCRMPGAGTEVQHEPKAQPELRNDQAAF